MAMDSNELTKIIANAKLITDCDFSKEEYIIFNKHMDKATNLCNQLSQQSNHLFLQAYRNNSYYGPTAHWSALFSVEGTIFSHFYNRIGNPGSGKLVYLILGQTTKYRIGVVLNIIRKTAEIFTNILIPVKETKTEIIGIDDEETRAGIRLLEEDKSKKVVSDIDNLPFTLQEVQEIESKNRAVYIVQLSANEKDWVYGTIYLGNSIEYFSNRLTRIVSSIFKKYINIHTLANLFNRNYNAVRDLVDLDPNKSNFSNYKKIIKHCLSNDREKINKTHYIYPTFDDRTPLKLENLSIKLNRHSAKYMGKMFNETEYSKYMKESKNLINSKSSSELIEEIGIKFKKEPKNLSIYYIYDVKEVKETASSNIRFATLVSHNGNYCSIVAIKDDSPLYSCIDKGNIFIRHNEVDVSIVSRITNKHKIISNAARIVNAIKEAVLNQTKYNFIEEISSNVPLTFNGNGPETSEYWSDLRDNVHPVHKKVLKHPNNVIILSGEELDELILANLRLGNNVEIIQKEQIMMVEKTQQSIVDSFYLGLIRLATTSKPFSIAPFGGNRTIEFTKDSISYEGNVLKSNILRTIFPLQKTEYDIDFFNGIFTLPPRDKFYQIYKIASDKKILNGDIISYFSYPKTIRLNGVEKTTSNGFYFGDHHKDLQTEFPDATNISKYIAQPIELDYNTLLIRFVNTLCNACYAMATSCLYDINTHNKVKFCEATIGNINIVIEYHRKSGRFYINDKAIRKVELNPVLMKANCFTEQKAYNKYLSNISSTSVRARELINNGLELLLFSSVNAKDPIIFFEFEKNSREWTLILRNSENKVLEKHPIINGISKFNKYITYRSRNNRLGVRTTQRIGIPAFSELLSDIPTFNENSLIKCLEIGTSLIDSRLARSRKLLQDTIETLKCEFLEAVGPAKISGYKVKGSSGTEYLVACSKVSENPVAHGGTAEFGSVYALPQLEYICIVDKSDEQSGYDMIVNRLYALANDKLIVSAVTTLRNHVK